MTDLANQLTPKDHPIMRRVLMTIALIVAGILSWVLRDVVLLFLTGMLLTLMLSLPVKQLCKLGLPWKGAVAVTLVTIFVIVGVTAYFTIPVFISQAEVFLSTTLPENIETLRKDILQNQFNIAQDVPMVSAEEIRSAIQGIGNSLSDYFWRFGQRIIPLVSRVAGVAIGLVFLAFIVIFALLDPKKYHNGFLQLVSEKRQHRVSDILSQLHELLQQWIGATLVSMLLMTIAAYIGFRFLGLPQPALLAIITGLTSFVPNFGPIVALIPAMIAGISGSDTSLILIPVIIYGLTFLQNQILNPVLMSRVVDVPPLMVLGGQIAFGVIFGFAGLVLAVPMTIITMLLVRELYVKDFLGNHASIEAALNDEYLPLKQDKSNETATSEPAPQT
jgi:predicted PurR-regulated permease PerM